MKRSQLGDTPVSSRACGPVLNRPSSLSTSTPKVEDDDPDANGIHPRARAGCHKQTVEALGPHLRLNRQSGKVPSANAAPGSSAGGQRHGTSGCQRRPRSAHPGREAGQLNDFWLVEPGDGVSHVPELCLSSQHMGLLESRGAPNRNDRECLWAESRNILKSRPQAIRADHCPAPVHTRPLGVNLAPASADWQLRRPRREPPWESCSGGMHPEWHPGPTCRCGCRPDPGNCTTAPSHRAGGR